MARFKTFIRSFSSFEHLRDLYGLYIDWTAVLDLQLFYLAPSFPQIILRVNNSGVHYHYHKQSTSYHHYRPLSKPGNSHKPAFHKSHILKSQAYMDSGLQDDLAAHPPTHITLQHSATPISPSVTCSSKGLPDTYKATDQSAFRTG